jgi:hypothetical protein
VKYGIDVRTATIDADYRGNVKIHLANTSNVPFTVTCGDRIAQLVLIAIASPTAVITEILDTTEQSDNGFGSSGIQPKVCNLDNTKQEPPPPPNILDSQTIKQPTNQAITDNIVTTDGIKPYDIWLSADPFDKRLTVQIDVQGNHPTLGHKLDQCKYRNRP